MTKKDRELSRRAEKVASKATSDNPVPVMLLGAVQLEARRVLNNGLSDDEAEIAVRDFIKQMNART